jgi:hypothetical protein
MENGDVVNPKEEGRISTTKFGQTQFRKYLLGNMNQQDFISLLSTMPKVRIGVKKGARIVVHSSDSNSSFKVFFVGDYWILETWQPVAFAFPLSETLIHTVVSQVLEKTLHEQTGFILNQFQEVLVLLRFARIESFTTELAISQKEASRLIGFAISQSTLTSELSKMDFRVVTLGFRLRIDSHLLIGVSLNSMDEGPIENDQNAFYVSSDADRCHELSVLLQIAELVLTEETI